MRTSLLLLMLIMLISSISRGQQPVQLDTLIILERDPGYFGMLGDATCPFYKLTISADGVVELEPKDYREHRVVTGAVIRSQISVDGVSQLTSEFEHVDFFSFKSTFENKQNTDDDCPQYGTDNPTATITITTGGRTKRVEHYLGCRGTKALSKLTELENKIEEIVNIKQWFDCHQGKNRLITPVQTND